MIGSSKYINMMVLLQGLEVGGLERMAVDLVNNLPQRYRITMCCYDSLGPLAKRLSDSADVIHLKRKKGLGYEGWITYKKW